MDYYNVIIHAQVYVDTSNIHEHIASENLEMAKKVVKEIFTVAKSLNTMPTRGAVLKTTRELDIEYRFLIAYNNYRVIYYIDHDSKEVNVINIIHTASNMSQFTFISVDENS